MCMTLEDKIQARTLWHEHAGPRNVAKLLSGPVGLLAELVEVLVEPRGILVEAVSLLTEPSRLGGQPCQLFENAIHFCLVNAIVGRVNLKVRKGACETLRGWAGMPLG